MIFESFWKKPRKKNPWTVLSASNEANKSVGNKDYRQPNRVRENPHWIWSHIFNVPNVLLNFHQVTIWKPTTGVCFCCSLATSSPCSRCSTMCLWFLNFVYAYRNLKKKGCPCTARKEKTSRNYVSSGNFLHLKTWFAAPDDGSLNLMNRADAGAWQELVQREKKTRDAKPPIIRFFQVKIKCNSIYSCSFQPWIFFQFRQQTLVKPSADAFCCWNGLNMLWILSEKIK